MPDPTWSEAQAGSTFVNGLYTYIGDHDDRPMWQREGEEDLRPILCWVSAARRWYVCPYPASPGTGTWYYTDQYEWDLPDVIWQVAGSGEAPVCLFVSWASPPLPSAVNLLCNGRQEPIGLLDPTPTLSWTFVPANGGPPQTAYQVHVATTQALLNAHTPDLWDSGVIVSSLQGAIYVGLALPPLETHWWGVRVRDANGLWSEDW